MADSSQPAWTTRYLMVALALFAVWTAPASSGHAVRAMINAIGVFATAVIGDDESPAPDETVESVVPHPSRYLGQLEELGT